MRSTRRYAIHSVVFVGVVSALGCTGQDARGYSAVGIEMAFVDRFQESDLNDSIARLGIAGPTVVPELGRALESSNAIHRSMAGNALRAMTQHWKWPEAYAFVLQRLKRLPDAEEAGWLLYAAAHEGMKVYPDILVYAANYVYYDDKVLTLSVSSPHNLVEMRICDYAAWIIQLISGKDFGIPEAHEAAGPDSDWCLVCPPLRSDEAVAKAVAWVQKNMERRKNGKRIIVMPEFVKKSR